MTNLPDDLDISPAELPGESEPSAPVVPSLSDDNADDGTDAVTSEQSSVPMSAAERVRARMKTGGTRRAGKASRNSEPASTSTPPRAVPPKPRAGTLVKPLTRLYVSVGTMLLPFDQACATAVIENAESCARALEALAQENEAVRRAILAMTQTSAWGGLIVAHLPILLMVAMHHGPKDVATSLAPVARMMQPGGPLDDSNDTNAEGTAA